MSKRILVGDQINAQLATARVEQQNFLAAQRAPVAPYRFVIAISERVLSVELKFIDLEICQMLNQLQKSLQFRHAATGNVEHDSAPREVRVIANNRTRQASSKLAQKLAQSGDPHSQSPFMPIVNL